MNFKKLISLALYLLLCACSSTPIAYITNQGSDTVSIVNLKEKKVIQEISVGKGPVGIAISLKKSYAFITNSNDASVNVLDLQHNRIIKTIKIGGTPVGITKSTNEDFIYVSDWFNSEILIIETKSLTIIKKIAVGKSPSGVVCDADGKYLFISNRDENTVEIYNQFDLNLVKKIKVGNHPYGLFISKNLLFHDHFCQAIISFINIISEVYLSISVDKGSKVNNKYRHFLTKRYGTLFTGIHGYINFFIIPG
jgi:YVTN family beta-propeller protein